MSRFKYQQLANELLQQINARQWQAGEKLPSVRWLCRHYQRSLATVQHALHLLEAQGVIEAKSRAGCRNDKRLAAVESSAVRHRQSAESNQHDLRARSEFPLENHMSQFVPQDRQKYDRHPNTHLPERSRLREIVDLTAEQRRREPEHPVNGNRES